MRAPGEIVQKGTYNELVQEGKDFGAFVEALQESLHNVNRASHTSLEGTEVVEALQDSMAETRAPWGTASSGDQKVVAARLSSKLGRSLSKRRSGSKTSDVTGSGKQTTGKLIQEEVREVGRVDKRVIWSYLSKVRNGGVWSLVPIPQAVTTLCSLCGDLWLASGTSSEQPTNLRFMLIYVVFLACCSFSVFVRARLIAWIGVATAQAFFTGMLNSIIRAPMSFIDSTPVGRILSRVSFHLLQQIIDVRNVGSEVGFHFLLGLICRVTLLTIDR